MKKVLVILAMCVVLSVCQDDDEVTAEDMQKWIRARGTFMASLVNMTEKMDYQDSKVQVRQEAVDALKYLLQIDFGSKYVLQLNDTEYNFYLNPEIELPNLCNPNNFQTEITKDKAGNQLKNNFIDFDALTSIVYGAKDMEQCWLKQVDKQLPSGKYDYFDTTTMPFLNPSQVAGFYKCVTTNDAMNGNIPSNYIYPDDAFVDPVALISVLTWGDVTRTDYGWLELWVYMCSLGRQPKTHKYMTKDPNALKTYMDSSIQKRRKQSVARNMMDLGKSLQDLQDKIASISAGKEDPTKQVNADGTISDYKKGTRLRKRHKKHHKKHHKQNNKKTEKKKSKTKTKGKEKYTEEQKKQLIPLLKEWDKLEMKKQDLIKQIRGEQQVPLDPLKPIDKKRMLRKAKIFNKLKSKRDEVESVIDKVVIDSKEVEKSAKKMKISHKSLELAKVLRAVYDKASSSKIAKMLKKRRMKKMRHSRKE